MLYIITLLPVLIFLGILLWLDSFSLVKKGLLLMMFGWGMLSVWLAMYGNMWMGNLIPFQLMVSPIIEEILKAVAITAVIKSRRSAFFLDAAIYGAAIGAGFAFLENIMYIHHFPDMFSGTAVVRGFGTAIMHCGTVISTAVILSLFAQKREKTLRYLPVAIIPAILLHALYNSLILPPVILLIVVFLGVILWVVLLIVWNEKNIGKWLDMELSSEIEMLSSLKKGEFSTSRAGKYMIYIREQFIPERFFDMCCYVQLYYELSIASKTNIMLAEAGFPQIKKSESAAKIKEFRILEKRIGAAARYALSPLVKQNRLNSWKIESLI